jgi:hypothetical protein
MRKTIFRASLTAAALVALGIPAASAGGPPTVTESPGTLCGIQGTWIVRITNDRSTLSGAGYSIEHFTGSFTFVSSATGKWIELSATGTNKMLVDENGDPVPVDNGDGTYSYVTYHSGSGIRTQTSDRGAAGPNYGAGHELTGDIFDAATGDWLGFFDVRPGNRPPPPDGGDPCDEWVAALT